MKFNDLEICKAVAEIEGLESRQCGNVECAENHYVTDNTYSDGTKYYNPLSDDALCFQLMVKYKISLIQHHDNSAVYCMWDYDEKQATNTITSPKRAICLAIIEKHKVGE